MAINDFGAEKFLLDRLYSEDKDYPANGNFLKKFLYYKGQIHDGIDADVSREMMEIYKKYPYFFDKKVGETTIQPDSQKKYEFRADGICYRGETLVNCTQLLLRLCNYEQCNKLSTSDIEEIERRLEQIGVLESDLLQRFVRLCYSEGNFFAIPYCGDSKGSLNLAKGLLKKTGYGVDNHDCYFKVLADYFVNGTLSCKLVKLIDEEEKYSPWKNRYKTGTEQGVEKFVSDHLFGAFFEGTRPKEFWRMTERGFEYDVKNYLEQVNEALAERKKEVRRIAE